MKDGGEKVPSLPTSFFQGRLLLPKAFKNILSLLRIPADMFLKFDNDGISGQSRDAKQRSAFHFRLERSAFETFQCNKVTWMYLKNSSVRSLFSGLMHTHRKADALLMTVSGTELTFDIKCRARPVGSIKVEIEETTEALYAVPEVTYECSARLSSSRFHQTLDTLTSALFTHKVTISVDDNLRRSSLSFSASAVRAGEGDVSKVRMLLPQHVSETNKSDNVTIDFPSKVKLYPLGFRTRDIHPLLKRAYILSSCITINLSNTQPMMIEYPLSDESLGYLNWYVVPRRERKQSKSKTGL
jgi:hypothetical protein